MEPLIVPPRPRLHSIDALRGLVICLMALDHTRDFFHASSYAYDPLDAAQTTPAVFLTRWITHVCAPAFLLLAGVSAWLQHHRGKSIAQLSRFLLARGVWLLVLEVTVISFGWAFSVPYLIYLQVIWAIGCSMIALAALIWLPRAATLAISLGIIVGHNLFDGFHPAGHLGQLWAVLHSGGRWPNTDAALLLITYPLLVWIAVMALGYAIAPVFLSLRRGQILTASGVLLLVFFFGLRALNLYGDPHPWTSGETPAQTVMHFFNVQKYPPSLLFLSVTLGILFLLAPLFDRWDGRFTDILRVFGSVPLFAYVVHIYLLHAANIVLLILTHRSMAGAFDQVRSAFFLPETLAGSSFSLPVVYVVWLAALVLLYPLCRWWAMVKSRRRSWWISYL
ncbi:DUF1624 domain-containing protein [Terriglobus albidus]|uniref:DUF1624 domain-containing protein n=1 Tax=Terriglobus albidus TaxID=1592106 RepID=A0A5B9E5K9_9BACT|nr:heparan-alpha-glucosaminide N-acetyltransferase domain-containing protein [Terriglobus albidus]QEE27079.1 DUF1624 domain-containing protein [Terriglobus albidus]